ncbi:MULTISPECIES: hypothetical protein [Streptomyces]|uniref:hypothetical protein n=1 Tax=Streptomyces TaxID=1883 RepID=UPI001F093471|nr:MULTISPECIES: hypothetical protein [Streptomyces]MDI6519203.1 hypothetical protein [Streptomyces coelicoflavus]
MSTATSTPLSARPPAAGAVNLYAPTDWFDLVEDISEDSARARYEDLINRSYPQHEPSVRADFTAALLTWREILRKQGLISYGLVTVPAKDGGPAVWQIMAAVVDVPTVQADLDLGEVAVRLLGEELEGRAAYTESYPTQMGLGLGIISQPVMSPEGDLTLFPAEEAQSGADASVGRIGLAVSLSCPPGGDHGLLVVGNCLDPEQVVPLAGVVAVIGGNSTFVDDVPDTDETESET